MTPSLASRIRELAIAGTRPRTIYDDIQRRASLQTIYNVIARAREEGHDIPRHKTGRVERAPASGERTTMVIGLQLSHALAPYAKARQMTIPDLVRALIIAAVEDKLIDAILDDAAGES